MIPDRERRNIAVQYVKDNSDFDERFAPWLMENWHVYLEFERLARDGIDRGRKRLAAKLLFELMRWFTPVREDGAEYKINNNYAPYCARLFDELNPNDTGYFCFRACKTNTLVELI